MAAPRASRLRGTRAPEGASAGRRPADATYREVPLWPGIDWGHTADCSCSWSYRDGAAQVKVLSGACTVHLAAPKPPLREEPPLPDDGLTVEDLIGQVIGLLAQALGEADRRPSARCGTRSGYKKHRREQTPACAECLEAVRLIQGKRRTTRKVKAPRRSRRGERLAEAA